MGKGELTLVAFQAGMQSEDAKRTIKVMRRLAGALQQHYRLHHANQGNRNSGNDGISSSSSSRSNDDDSGGGGSSGVDGQQDDAPPLAIMEELVASSPQLAEVHHVWQRWTNLASANVRSGSSSSSSSSSNNNLSLIHI